jgi:hypothetical protein
MHCGRDLKGQAVLAVGQPGLSVLKVVAHVLGVLVPSFWRIHQMGLADSVWQIESTRHPVLSCAMPCSFEVMVKINDPTFLSHLLTSFQ